MAELGTKYFQFPICSLAFLHDEQERLNHVISYSCVEAGNAMIGKLSPEILDQKANNLDYSSKTPSDYDGGLPNHTELMVGSKEINVSIPSVRTVVEQWQRLARFRENFEHAHGRDAEVRIATSLLFEARDGGGISYRELTLLCAVYSCIGAKDYPVRITRSALQCRALGYKSPRVMRVEISRRTDGAALLTLRQINYTLDKLHERRFFARARANARQTYYSHRMTEEELRDAILGKKSYSHRFHELRRHNDAKLMSAIKNRRGAG